MMERFTITKYRKVMQIWLMTALSALSTLLLFSSCESLNPLSSEQITSTGQTVESNVGPITILSVDPAKVAAIAPRSLYKYTDPDQYFAEEYVKRTEDKELKLGDGDTGESKVKFKKYNLPASFTVFFEWAADDSTYTGEVNAREAAGHNAGFNAPVYTELSYRMANLMDVDESSIAAYAYNPNSGQWENLGGEIDYGGQRIKTYIHHFGKLALFHTQNGSPVQLMKVQDVDFYDKAYIESDDDGKLEVEGPGLDKSMVEIKKYDLPHNMTVTFEWAAGGKFEGWINSVEYGSNVTLNHPVLVRLSYKNARLLTVNEDSIGVYMYNETGQDWELIGGTVDAGHNEIEVYITRFGKIALFHMEDGVPFEIVKLGEYMFYAEQFVKRQKGGGIKLGNAECGESKIKINKHALLEDTEIKFEWAAGPAMEGVLGDLTFGPHGTQFIEPVLVELSYRMADLTGIDESTLQVFYYNEDTQLWELIGGVVDISKKKITVYLPHFSRYALSKG